MNSIQHNFHRPTKSRTSKITRFLPVCLSAALLAPVVIYSNGAESPIDIVMLDFFVLIFAASCFLQNGKFNASQLNMKCVIIIGAYLVILASFTSAALNSVLPLFSVVKFGKFLVAILAGYAFATRYSFKSAVDFLSDGAALLILLLGISEFVYIGNFSPRLGAMFFEFPTYGFPNSSASYIVFVVCLALVKNRTPMFMFFLFVISIALALGSLSRSALILIVLLWVFYSVVIFRRSPITVLSAPIILFFAIDLISSGSVDGDVLFKIRDAIVSRYHSSTDADDLSNGRLHIFKTAIDLILQKPIFGYGFESFSNYGRHSTPHNQYLEILYKTGIVGFSLYMFIIYDGFKKGVSRLKELGKEYSSFAFFLLLLLVMIGNMSQPNLSYSMTGNVIFFLIGAIFSKSKNRRIMFDAEMSPSLGAPRYLK